MYDYVGHRCQSAACHRTQFILTIFSFSSCYCFDFPWADGWRFKMFFWIFCIAVSTWSFFSRMLTSDLLLCGAHEWQVKGIWPRPFLLSSPPSSPCLYLLISCIRGEAAMPTLPSAGSGPPGCCWARVQPSWPPPCPPCRRSRRRAPSPSWLPLGMGSRPPGCPGRCWAWGEASLADAGGRVRHALAAPKRRSIRRIWILPRWDTGCDRVAV